MESKKDIRKKIFVERKLHTDEQIEAMSRTITDKVTALPAFKNADRILVYADYNHEVVTEYLIKEAWKAGKEVAVPKVVGKDMVFYKLTDFWHNSVPHLVSLRSLKILTYAFFVLSEKRAAKLLWLPLSLFWLLLWRWKFILLPHPLLHHVSIPRKG